MKKKHDSDVSAIEIEKEGFRGMFARYLWSTDDGCRNFAMRVMEFEPGGHTSYHYHAEDHEFYCPRRGMGEKPSPLGEDFSGPAGPETWLPRSGSKAPHSPITAVGEKGIFLGGCESRIHPDKRKCRRSHRL